MTENEIIVVDGIPHDVYRSIVEQSLRYAILSLPFTVNRMALASLKSRLMNIAKGKIAEALFLFFARQNAIPLDDNPCRTPFYRPDRRDFVLNGLEWDLKNNFLVHSQDLLPEPYIRLPALVPDRHGRDQWAKRNEQENAASKGVAFLFTFMKLRDQRQSSVKGFFDLNFTKAQLDLLFRACAKYRGNAQLKPPFREDDFWKKWQRLGGQEPLRFTMNAFPALIITAYATRKEFGRFESLPPDQTFLNGALHTRIKNRGTLIQNLPSFVSLFPRLKEHLRFARFRDLPSVSER